MTTPIVNTVGHFLANPQAGHYLHWRFVNISYANLAIIVSMIVVFVIALAVPFTRPKVAAVSATPRQPELVSTTPGRPSVSADGESDSWTVRLRDRVTGLVPPGEALPDKQPAYVASWIYVFGVLTLAAFVVAVATGTLLAIGGVTWWHVSSLGHFVNSLHLWSVELLFAFMVVHLWGKFWMAAWRGKRLMTWITGVILFVASIGTAFTGYLSQENFASQWIAAEGKDGINSIGVGGWFNVLNPGQMLLWHVVLLPLVVGGLTVWHIILVRRHGVVPPLDAKGSN